MSDKKKPQPSDAALAARLAQLELENRMRLAAQQAPQGTAPIKDTPRKGFGSAQGIAHLRHTEFQRRGPNPPVPPPQIPEPGKARFGGTYLKTPLPGIISADATPGEELITPVPATPSGAPSKDYRPPAAGPARPNAPAGANQPPPSGVMPSHRPMHDPTAAAPRAPAKEAGTAPAMPAAAQFDPGKRGVIGGNSIPKAPLPALYHAGMKAAEGSDTGNAAFPAPPTGRPPGTVPESKTQPTGSAKSPLQVPEGSEVLKEVPGAKAAPRAKRFKNPSMPAKE